MIEAGILFLVYLALLGLGLGMWRAVVGRARCGRRWVGSTVCVSLGALLLLAVTSWRLVNAGHFQLLGEIVTHVETDQPLVALTFDDGPTSRYTEEVLEILHREGVHATFFVVGKALMRNPAECQRMVAEGHELGNHSYSHDRMIFMPYALVQEEIERTDQLIYACGHAGPIHFRSPYGKKLILLPYYLSRSGRKNVFWNVAPEGDRSVAQDAGQMVRYVMKEIRPGSIILLHVMSEKRAVSREALPAIIKGLRERGYRFVTVSELLAIQ